MIRRNHGHESIGVDVVEQLLTDVARDLYGDAHLEIESAVPEHTERVAVLVPSDRERIIAANLIYDPDSTENVDPFSMAEQARTGLRILHALGVDNVFGFKILIPREGVRAEPTSEKTSFWRRIIMGPTKDPNIGRGTVYAIEYPPLVGFIDAWNAFCDYAEQKEPDMKDMPRFALFDDGNRELYEPDEYEAARTKGRFLISAKSFEHDFAGHVLGATLLSPESNRAQAHFAGMLISVANEENMSNVMRRLDRGVSTTPLSVVQVQEHGDGYSLAANPHAAIKRYCDGFGVDNETAEQLLEADQRYFTKLARLLKEYGRVEHNTSA